jgi:hypothetical protein
MIPFEQLISRGHLLAAAHSPGAEAGALTRQELEASSIRWRAAEIAVGDLAVSRRDGKAQAAGKQAAALAAERLEREHPGAQVEQQQLRSGWGLAARVGDWPGPGAHAMAAGPVGEVSAWLDAVRLGRDHPGAAVRVVKDWAGNWVLNAALDGGGSAQGDPGLVGEWLALKDPAGKQAGAPGQRRPGLLQ